MCDVYVVLCKSSSAKSAKTLVLMRFFLLLPYYNAFLNSSDNPCCGARCSPCRRCGCVAHRPRPLASSKHKIQCYIPASRKFHLYLGFSSPHKGLRLCGVPVLLCHRQRSHRSPTIILQITMLLFVKGRRLYLPIKLLNISLSSL